MIFVILETVGLRHQHFAVAAIPGARPRLVSPAKAEGKVWLAALQNLVHGPFEQLFPREPIVVVAEGADAVFLRQRGLGGANLGLEEIVVAEFAGCVRLLVTGEERPALL